MQHIFNAALLWACCLASPVVQADPESSFNPSDIRAEFIAADNYPEQYRRLLELEQQAFALIEDEPLKLGSLGGFILETYPASQTGHYAMMRYYAHVEADEAEAEHKAKLSAVQAAMRASGDGQPDKPYAVMTIYDAQTYAQSIDNSPVGSIYQTADDLPLTYLLITQPEDAKLRQVFFDLSHSIDALVHGEESATASQAALPWTVIRILAAKMDTAAQAAIGAFLTRSQKFDSAIGWLKVASRTGNILANTLLARIHWQLAETSDDEEQKASHQQLSLENYLHAIALGSTDSMYTLAGLYLNDYYGEDNREAAIPLLRQAGALGHAESLLFLAHIYNTGQYVDEDRPQAIEFYKQAAALEHPLAVIGFARFLIADAASGGEPVSAPIMDWLTEIAEDDNAEAMIMLGNLYARGVNTKASNRKAVSWYKKAIKADPDDADIVNEVAWTLTVSDVPKLKRIRYAHRLMEKLMKAESSDASDRPEYLDTWAATYAATGNFTQAIEIQNRAIETASAQEREDVMAILQDHLDQFKSNQAITEPAP